MPVAVDMEDISIHALREEGDACASCCTSPLRNFYPRPPRGGRQLHHVTNLVAINFYPRPPRGGRRDHPQLSPYHQKISIHALREEGDPHIVLLIDAELRFLSTPSARRATR